MPPRWSPRLWPPPSCSCWWSWQWLRWPAFLGTPCAENLQMSTLKGLGNGLGGQESARINKHRDKAVKQGLWLFWQHTKSENCILCDKNATRCSASRQQKSFPVFRSAWLSVRGYPRGRALLPLIDGVLATSERGHGALSGGVSFFQHSYRKTDGQFNTSYSTLCCQNLKQLAVHRCAQLFSYTTVGRSCTQSEVITVVVLHLLRTRKDCLHHRVAQYAQRAHIHLPGSVFLLPSAPMMTSNSSSLTGCVLGWTSALQPISARCSAHVIRQKCTRRASRRPLTGDSGARHVLAFSSWCFQMHTYFQSFDLLGVQQDPWTRHWHGSRCPAGEPFWAASVGADEYLRHEKSKTQSIGVVQVKQSNFSRRCTYWYDQ